MLTRQGLAAGFMLTAMALGVVGCSPREEPATPTSTPATSAPAPSSSPAPSMNPTEKAVSPGGNNSFSPTINPVPPGASCSRIENGVCVR